MNKYKVTLAVTVPAYAEIEIEAESQAAAEQAVAKELDECGDEFASRFWQDLTFEPEWQEAEDFRIIDASLDADPNSDEEQAALDRRDKVTSEAMALISAAPELLSVLGAILPHAARRIQGTTDGDPILNAARAAIAKAKGEIK